MASRLLATSDYEVILTGCHVYRGQDVILSPFDQELTASYSSPLSLDLPRERDGLVCPAKGTAAGKYGPIMASNDPC